MEKFINLAGIDFAGGGSAPVPPVPPVPPGPTPVDTAKDVNLRDYDGTIIASYTAEEFAALTDWPAAPVHEGLTFQGWNFSLQDAQTYVAAYGKVEIGATYITSDGKTRIYITLTKGRTSPTLGLCVNGSIDVDWGDGSAHDTVTGTSLTTLKNTLHSYAEPGDYVISLTPAEGATFTFIGSSSYNNSQLLWDHKNAYDSSNFVYNASVKAILIGQGVTTIKNYAFAFCQSLASVSIPQGVTSIESSPFYNCYGLKCVNIPQGVTSISSNTFRNCYGLTSVSIPQGVTSISGNAFAYCYGLTSVNIPQGVISIENTPFYECHGLTSVNIPQGVTSIGSSAFQNCYGLTSVNIPQGVTSISGYAFAGCYSLAIVIVNATTPPNIQSNTFNNLPTDAIIYVPAECVEEYKTASNWSAKASQIQAMP